MLSTSELSAQFRQVYLDPDPSNAVLNSSFYSATQGFVAFKNGIAFTSDGGKTFVEKPISFGNVDFGLRSVGFPWTLNGVKAFNNNQLIVYGDWGGVPSIMTSDNGGNSFTLVLHSRIDPLVLYNGFSAMVFPENGDVGFAIDENRVFRTVNKGRSWNLVQLTTGPKYRGISGVSNNHIFVHTDNTLFKTSNAGANWTQVAIPNGAIHSIDFIDQNRGWLNMYTNPSSDIFYTADGGTSWTKKNVDGAPFRLINFTDDRTGYALWGGSILKTTDSGRIWERVAQEGTGLARNGTSTDIFNLDQNQLWAGTSSGMLMYSNNAGGITIPSAIFSVDTAGVATTNLVRFLNFSKTNYTSKWFLNGKLLSTNYNAEYNPTPLKFEDTIQLVVSNGTRNSDTTTKIVRYSPVIITSFTPMEAPQGATVTITGLNFWSVNYVSFGGVAASFTYVSPTEIKAVVGKGASGVVYVRTDRGGGYKAGFVYNAPPQLNLNVSLSDSILCKSEPVQIRIRNSEARVDYRLVDADENVYGLVKGNGGEVVLQTTPVSSTGTYYIQMFKEGISATFTSTTTVSIRVEKTRSIIGADKINIATGEAVNLFQQSKEASTFIWNLHDGASTASFNGPNPPGITYASTGTKTATLISISSNGCRDTATLRTVTVYDKNLLSDECFAQNVEDIDTYDQYYTTTFLHPTQSSPDNGYIISGHGTAPILPSRAGSTKQLLSEQTAYVAKYNSMGVLLWQSHVGKTGSISNTAVDEQGNIYVLGRLLVHDYFFFNNGDSMRLGDHGDQLVSFYQRTNAFILKMDAAGKYLWHTIFYNSSPEGVGVSVADINASMIKAKNGRLIVAGHFGSALNYWRNGMRMGLKTGGSTSGSYNSFVLDLSTNGVINWGMYWNLSNEHTYSGLEVDASGNVFVSGIHEADVLIKDVGDSYSVTIPRAGYYDRNSYLAKFSPAGKFLWRTTLTSDVQMNALAVDPGGNVYLAGSAPHYYSPNGFEILEGNNTSKFVNPGNSCILKFDVNGNYLWGIGTEGPGKYSAGQALFIKGNDLYTTFLISRYEGSRTPYTIRSANGNKILHSAYESEFVLAKFTLDGNLQKIYNSGDNGGGAVQPNQVFVDANDNIIMSGLLDKYNGGPRTYNAFGKTVSSNGNDGFIIRMKSDLCFSGTPPKADAGNDALACAKTDITIGTSATGDRYVWASAPKGFESYSASTTVAPSVATTYYLYVTNNSGITAVDSVRVDVKTAPAFEAGLSRNVCSNSPVKIGSDPVAGFTYSWQSIPAGFTSVEASPTVQPTITTTYIGKATNADGCSTSDTVKLTTSGFLAVSVSITGSEEVCRNSEAVFTARSTNTGDKPVYQWKVNGKIVGDSTATFKSSELKQGDKLDVTVKASIPCAFPQSMVSTAKTIKIIDGVVPMAAIIPPQKTNVCVGETLVFDSDVINNVENIAWEWRLNDKKVGENKHFFELKNPADGDQVYLIVTASNRCGGRSADTTATVTVKVGAAIKPSVSIAGTANVTKGQPSIVVATISNAGTTSSQSWEDSTSTHGWATIIGATGKSITYTPDKTGDRIRCVVTSSDACSGTIRQASTALIFTVTTVTVVSAEPVGNFGVRIFPNPVRDYLYLRNLSNSDQWQTLKIIAADGRRNVIEKDLRGVGRLELNVNALSPGMYMLMLSGKTGKHAYFKFIKN